MMRLAAPWLDAPSTRRVMQVLSADEGGGEVLFVGGCVRNALLSVPVADIDLATDMVPETVINRARAAGLKAIPTGIEHGTVTVVAEHQPFEVTTYRRDVATDGRRAVVAFSTDIAEDAARRDFTMNALYARADGTVLDPLGGLDDLQARRVRFIGDPVARITEDGLRIIRFFRFQAAYGDPLQGPDPEGLAAIAANLDRLDPISAERIGSEIARLLAVADPAPALATMHQSGVLGRILPGADPKALGPLVHLEVGAGLTPDWHRRLAALGSEDAPRRLRLSRADARRVERIGDGARAGGRAAALAVDHGPDMAADILLVHAAWTEGPLPDNWQSELARGAEARFPLSAADLIPRYGQSPELGAALARLRTAWINSGFELDRAALLARDADP